MAGAAPAASSARLAWREPEGLDDGEGETETELGLDKGNVASRRDRTRPRGERGSPTADAWRRRRRRGSRHGRAYGSLESTVTGFNSFEMKLIKV